MLKQDVAALFNSLIRHGLKPPCAMQDKASRETLVNEFYEKYQSLNEGEEHELVQKFPLLGHWPTFADVDDIIANYRRELLAKQFGCKRQGATKRNQETEAALGHKPPLGEDWVMSMARKTAKRYFPEASLEFITENKLVLSGQCEKDFICDTCYGKPLHECRTGGHRTFLTVDPYSGLCVECVDCEKCGKVIVPDKEE